MAAMPMTDDEIIDCAMFVIDAPPDSRISKTLVNAVARSLAMGKPTAKKLSAAQSAARQANVVRMMFSGQRISLSRAWRLCQYARHNQSFNQWLASPAVQQLIREAILDGGTMPAKYASKILPALNLTAADVEALRLQGQEERDLGIR
jgi:hypothetical protein